MSHLKGVIEIVFKEVGQGDSIILRWHDQKDKKEKFGLIDCKLKEQNRNPALKHLKALGVDRFEFIILSHPHYDHYSGLKNIFEFSEQNGIYINNFLHTSRADLQYAVDSVKTYKAQNELTQLFLKARELRDTGLIKHFSYIDIDRQDLDLNDEISIRFLSPSTAEDEKFLQRQKTQSNEENDNNKPYANWLSSVLKIYSKDWYILLTSDAERNVLKKLGIDYPHEFKEKIIIGQAPHHGAYNNHYPAFWKKRINNDNNVPIIFSVGLNSNNHPSAKVIENFQTLNCKIYATNKVGPLSGMTDEEIINVTETEVMLDTISENVYKEAQNITQFEGDKKFQIDRDGKVSLIG
ncbi:MAG: hypothetical protein BRD50_06420 [Bacteroidetes bacterium SW_11_45_7]|nr:MAG: hypothetical protein BRD50_06420 [Bacteroidetes bacterium SW_11_45_7]